MAGSRALRRDRAGASGAGPALFVIALAVAVVATEVPFEDPQGAEAGAAREREFLAGVLKEDMGELEALLRGAWRGATGMEEAPAVRARLAADRLIGVLHTRYPRELEEVVLEFGDSRVLVDALSEEPIPSDIRIRLTGVLAARAGSDVRITRAVDLAERDPFHGRSGQFLREVFEDQGEDPHSAALATVRGRLVGTFTARDPPAPEDLDFEISAALGEAAAGVERRLGLAATTEAVEGAADLPARAPATFAAPDAADLLGALNDSSFEAFFEGFLERDIAPPVVQALARALLAWDAPLREAAIAAIRETVAAAELLLGPWVPWNRTLLRQAVEVLVRAARDLAQSARAAAVEAARVIAAMNPPATASSSTAFVQLRSSQARVLETRFWAPLLARAGVVLPFGGSAIVEFMLETAAAIPLPDGSVFRFNDRRVVRVEVPFASPGPPRNGAGGALPGGTPAAPLLEAAEGFSQAFSLLESLRQEVDTRAWKFREEVARKTAQGSAGTFSRLLFRVLNALESGDKNGFARGVFDFLERYVADALRDALAVNFTVLGVNFTLLPDPVRQQVSLQHARGPHTFGVRLRRITAEDNPLVGKFGDFHSVAVELYYAYSKAPLEVGLVIDPLMLTDEGLLRFVLRNSAGDGYLIHAAAPRFVHRSGVFEVSLGDLLPGLGGIPVGATPSGGVVVADIGARVEIGAVRISTVAKWILHAAEEAWLDTIANDTVGEVAAQFGIPGLARKLFERFLNRFADVAVAEASRALTRADLFLRVSDREAGGLVSSTVEAALSIREPLVALRELTSDLASLFRAAIDAAASDRPRAPHRIDLLSSALHERIGISLKVASRGGLGEFMLFPGAIKNPPDVTASQELYLSAGALATLAGRVGVHWVCEYTIAWEAPSKKVPGLRARLGKNDSAEIVHVRMEGLSGPKILISEVAPAPSGADADLEFIELYNPGFAEETLTGWGLVDAGGRRFALPPGIRIAPGGTLVLARSAAPFFARFGVVPAASSLTLALNDEGDRLRLVNERGMVSDGVAWGDASNPGVRVRSDEAIARRAAQWPPPSLPGSALVFTGSQSDFTVGAPTPGRLPR